mmetsp:Transcript_14264/g.43307  ORF Transcript_14264/g.43307 Transcript_14264/m.43307 type:complete len:209 (-) Transcript_14264:1185-1811(-)
MPHASSVLGPSGVVLAVMRSSAARPGGCAWTEGLGTAVTPCPAAHTPKQDQSKKGGTLAHRVHAQPPLRWGPHGHAPSPAVPSEDASHGCRIVRVEQRALAVVVNAKAPAPEGELGLHGLFPPGLGTAPGLSTRLLREDADTHHLPAHRQGRVHEGEPPRAGEHARARHLHATALHRMSKSCSPSREIDALFLRTASAVVCRFRCTVR